MKNVKKQKEKIFKKRKLSFSFKSLLTLKCGDSGFFFKNNINFEYVYITFFKKKVKKIKILNYKFWFFLSKNYPLSLKAKNSRMGKGKGDFLRWTYRLLSNYLFIEFFNFHLKILNVFRKFVNVKLPKKVFFFSKYLVFFCDNYLFSNYSYFLNKKYLI